MGAKDAIIAKMASLQEQLAYYKGQVDTISARLIAMRAACDLLDINPQVDEILTSCNIDLNIKD